MFCLNRSRFPFIPLNRGAVWCRGKISNYRYCTFGGWGPGVTCTFFLESRYTPCPQGLLVMGCTVMGIMHKVLRTDPANKVKYLTSFPQTHTYVQYISPCRAVVSSFGDQSAKRTSQPPQESPCYFLRARTHSLFPRLFVSSVVFPIRAFAYNHARFTFLLFFSCTDFCSQDVFPQRPQCRSSHMGYEAEPVCLVYSQLG